MKMGVINQTPYCLTLLFTRVNVNQLFTLSPRPCFFISSCRRTQRFKLYTVSSNSSFSTPFTASAPLRLREGEDGGVEGEELSLGEGSEEEIEENPNDPHENFDDEIDFLRLEMQLELNGEEFEGKCDVGFVGKGGIEGVVEEILELVRSLSDNSTLGERMGRFEGRVREKECVEVLRVMCEEGLMISCLYFCEWMESVSLVTPRACCVLFPALGKAGMGDKLMVLWKSLSGTRAFWDVSVYNSVLCGLLYSGRYKDAWEVHEEMEANNVLPNSVTGSIMITVMRKEGESAKETWDFFTRMNRKGVEWSLEIVGALMKSFCHEGLKKHALIVQTEMEKRGIPSDAMIYNILMDAYCKSNQLEEAEALFVEMKRKRLSPNSDTYNILMEAYSKRMQPDIVEKLLLEMQNAGCKPNGRSYTHLISAYGRLKKMSDMAADAFFRMIKSGIKPTSQSYTALIHAYSVSGEHKEAYQAFEEMQGEGIKPSVKTYTALLWAFRRAGNAEMLMAVWKLMIRDRIEGTGVTFDVLVDGFAKQGRYLDVRDVISEFGKMGFQPTVRTYNMLINAYARAGQNSKLPQLLKEMAVLNLKPDSVTYSTMIYAYIRISDFRRALFYHKQMIKSGQVPDKKSYQKLRTTLETKADIKNKKDKNAVLGIVNSKVGLLQAQRKSKKDEFWKYKKKRGISDGSGQGQP